jgi:hypothetical protein
MSADGKWNVVITSPMGSQEAVLTLATTEGQLTGQLSGPMGELEVVDGTIDGDHLEWISEVTAPVPLTVEFWVDLAGDTMSGDVKLGPMGSGSLSGTRS